MKNIDPMKRSLRVLLLLITALPVWANGAYDTWKAHLIREGQKQLAQQQGENAANDAAGHSDRNHYLVLVASDPTYPNAEFIGQRKGTGRGGADNNPYLLDQPTLASLDQTLRRMNSGKGIRTYVVVVHFMPLEFFREIPDDQSIADFFDGSKTDLVQAIAQPITDEASQLVRAITNSPTQRKAGACCAASPRKPTIRPWGYLAGKTTRG
jgi:hypothetical protein